MSCLNVSYERPSTKSKRSKHKESNKGRKAKKTGKINISWKWNASMGIMTTLLLAGVGVHGHDTFNDEVAKEATL